MLHFEATRFTMEISRKSQVALQTKVTNDGHQAPIDLLQDQLKSKGNLVEISKNA